jgi:hypothetical protein
MGETCPYFAILPRQTGLQRTDYLLANAVTELTFLWRAHGQSGFTEDTRRMQCDQKRGFGHRELTSVGIFENRFRYFPETRFGDSILHIE